MLSLLFLLSIWLDRTQPSQAPQRTYGLLFVYVLIAFGIAAVTWRNWWIDARMAVPSHFLDMAVFTGIIFSTNGYTSPFFLFFILPLLAAAIRWGWRETALTAAALILFYITAGLLVAGSESFELQRFIVRSGHLLILSAVLIWFGMHQQSTRLFLGVDELDRQLGGARDPIRQALTLAMDSAHAGSGCLLLGTGREARFEGLCICDGAAGPATAERPLITPNIPVVLFDTRRDRSLTRQANGQYRFLPVSRVLDGDALRELGAKEGFVAGLRTGTQFGWLVLWDVHDLSIDFLDLGPEIARAAGVVLDRNALLSAMEEGAAARTRLSLARDVHDSVVQFLAGAAFRVEAIIRSLRAGGQSENDLQELKRLLIEEQGEIRSFVSALRRDRGLELSEAVEELRSLAGRLGRQWSIDCSIDANTEGPPIPIRLQLDIEQLLREAVANAVRHGKASRVDVEVGVEEDQFRLEVTDNGSGFLPVNGRSAIQPWSLKERVERARGSLSLRSEPGRTNVLITLPLTGAAA
jgi:signal transduction histidine kinase